MFPTSNTIVGVASGRMRLVVGMKRFVICFAVVVLLECLPAPNAQADTLSDRLLVDAQDQSLDSFGFLDACLVSGGTNDQAGISKWRATFQRHQKELRTRIQNQRVPKSALPGYIFSYLQQRILIGRYEALCTDV